MRVQQVDHRPQVPAFLDVDLEEVAQVVERRRGLAEITLLLDRGRLGVALNDDQAAQHGAVFARHLLPGGLALVRAERNFPIRHLRGEQDAPLVLGHLHIIEFRPALRIDAHGRAQIDQRLLESLRAHVLPPVDVAGVPLLQRVLHPGVAAEIDVVRDKPVIVDVDDVHGAASLFSRITSIRCAQIRSRSKVGDTPLP